MKPSDKSKDKSSMLTAQRFEGKPLRQPPYNFQDVPFCKKDLSGSCILEVSEREVFTDAIAEMLLLCKEVMRRKNNHTPVVPEGSRNTVRTTKPLSLEYIADRIDVDDPLFGFLIRTENPIPSCGVCDSPRKSSVEGMLQGFLTITTFTTWQKTFRWDSRHEAAFSLDEPELALQMATGKRIYDNDGSLAAELESTVRCGDVWNEGVVWPHVAEISLLGGLGCGKALLSLAIERLEQMPATASRNYDYVVLHATANAVEFYEDMGFVRVGAITQLVTEDEDNGGSDKPLVQTEIVSSPIVTYYTKKHDETPIEIANVFGVNVWDLIFLNHYAYPSIEPKSYLKAKTKLFIPKKDGADGDCNSQADDTVQWYIAKEDETPKSISSKFNLSCHELIDANRSRLPDLYPCSRLMKGTKIQISHFHIRHESYVPFCHWTFPDEASDHTSPSYMMVKKLNRLTAKLLRKGPVESSFSVPVTKPVVNNTVPTHREVKIVTNPTKVICKKRKFEEGLDSPPKKPLTSFFLFMKDEKKNIQADSFDGMTEFSKNAAVKWRNLPASLRAKYDAEYERQKSQYLISLSKFQKKKKPSNPDIKANEKPFTPTKHRDSQTKVNLFNKIVKLKKGGSIFAHPEFDYYYVLTYIPDLFWCHLAPLRIVGVFGPNKPAAEGRPIWMLVNEEEGKEVDISAQYCEVVRARAMKGGIDADKEQWDIYSCSTPDFSTSKGTGDWTKTLGPSDVLHNTSSDVNALSESTNEISEREQCHVRNQVRGISRRNQKGSHCKAPIELISSLDDEQDNPENEMTEKCNDHNTHAMSMKSNLAGVSAIIARRAAMKARHLLS